MQGSLTDKQTAASSAVIDDFDWGGGIFDPSSFRRIDDKLMDELYARDAADRINLIFDKCFGISKDVEANLVFKTDFPIVEIEQDLYVLELANAKQFNAVDKKIRSLLIASVFVSTYVDLAIEGRLRLFLPFVSGEFIRGAIIAKHLGVPFEIVVGVNESKADECQQCLTKLEQEIDLYVVPEDEIGATIKAFCEFDDYVCDPVTAVAVGAFEGVEDEDPLPSVVVSVKSPMQCARETLCALGVKSKDEKEAREKLEELFAVEPLDE